MSFLGIEKLSVEISLIFWCPYCVETLKIYTNIGTYRLPLFVIKLLIIAKFHYSASVCTIRSLVNANLVLKLIYFLLFFAIGI